MKTTTFLIACCAVLSMSAQVSDTYYFNSDYQLLPSKTGAAFTAIVTTDSAFVAPGNYHYEVYNSSGNLMYYNDSEHFLLQNSDSIILYTAENEMDAILYFSTDDIVQKEVNYSSDGSVSSVKTYRKGREDSLFYYKHGSVQKAGKFVNSVYEQVYYIDDAGVKNFTSVREVVKEQRRDSGTVYTAEKMPQFPGGDKEMYTYLGQNIKYPKYAKDHKLEGKVYLHFVVNKKGTITQLNIARGIHPVMDFETMRAVSIMPKWSPGEQNGENVDVYFTLPVLYKLNK